HTNLEFSLLRRAGFSTIAARMRYHGTHPEAALEVLSLSLLERISLAHPSDTSFDSHVTHRVPQGIASSRFSGMGCPQLLHIPYVPFSMRASACCTSKSNVFSLSRIACSTSVSSRSTASSSGSTLPSLAWIASLV